jgi:hypothetical protein
MKALGYCPRCKCRNCTAARKRERDAWKRKKRPDRLKPDRAARDRIATAVEDYRDQRWPPGRKEIDAIAAARAMVQQDRTVWLLTGGELDEQIVTRVAKAMSLDQKEVVAAVRRTDAILKLGDLEDDFESAAERLERRRMRGWPRVVTRNGVRRLVYLDEETPDDR